MSAVVADEVADSAVFKRGEAGAVESEKGVGADGGVR